MENEGRVPANLKKRLALAVRSIQWSYGIFWSISNRQSKVLEWGDGYYNGDIKTRKTIQSMDFNADQIGLQRSEQLRELYVSLSTSESNPQAKRPSAALSPEDLTDTEWYYMVCMSFVFDIGQGLPGRTLATNRSMWICNAPYADSKVFTRSLLSKSASVQTVVCFPFLGGVVELGATEQVPEDPSLIHFVRTSFLEILNPIASQRFVAHHVPHSGSDDLACDLLNLDFEGPQSVPVIGAFGEISPCSSSDRFEPAAFPESSFPVKRANAIASQAQDLQCIDEDFGNWTNASECVSEATVEPSPPVLEDGESLQFSELAMLDDPTNDRYHNILAIILRTSSRLIVGQHFRNISKASSFTHWKKGEFSSSHRTHRGAAQKLLKKILFEVPQMYETGVVSSEDNGHKKVALRPDSDDVAVNHPLERRRKETINERLTVLKSMIPLTDETDKVSALDETIKYVQELERRVFELESCRSVPEGESRPNWKSLETGERTSDNCFPGKRLSSRKRKGYDTNGGEIDSLSSALTVTLNNRNAQIKMRCAWREGLLLDVINEAKNLGLETHSIRSSTVDDILALTITSKFTGTTIASATTIKRALERFALREGQ